MQDAGDRRVALLAMFGLPSDADRDDVVRRYRRLARQTHPDVSRTGDASEAAGDFAALTDAYHAVLDELDRSVPPPPAGPTRSDAWPGSRPRPLIRHPKSSQPPIVAGPVTVRPTTAQAKRADHD